MGRLELSRHAQSRVNQRGVQMQTLRILLDTAEQAVCVGGGCSAVSLSRSQIQDADLRREHGGRLDRMARLKVICADDTGEIVTVMIDRNGRDGRRYRRRR